mmetsp:Transcript_155/g.301  ORF Transcript_155/g.301 Transcript_155/m.301 type:complete len:448 (-) Transcript_155:486-1829(-)|eukprot:CAMPEP_0179413598 /NCGR_PEP_ID=MMETSP0799-20121207/5188_1 /TAXON_ID=46947 /ORGANISM="Geminigera cryophila, Strain CCMP2564" /LENGTH=447 /DNA_ID=CAMNT_0021186089 /DNA_START=25 /DNA_END=1368 /DNA_ORIENTATION=-
MPKNSDGEYRRTNGFEKPFDRLQFVSWIISFYLIFSFFLVVLPLMEDTTKIWTSIIYALLMSAFLLLATRTGGVDPVDKTTLKLLQATPRDIPSSELLYCCFCKCKVHKRSKHCGLCNKCVGDFDHHCKWLNNCVGGTNYKSFFRLINIGVVYTAFHFVMSLTVLLSVLNEASFPMSTLDGSYYKGVNRTGLLAALILSCGFAGLTCAMLLHLVIFHLYLQHKQLSTYDYILLERARKTQTKSAAAPAATRSREKVTPEVTETRMDQANLGVSRQPVTAAATAHTETVSGGTMGSGGQDQQRRGVDRISQGGPAHKTAANVESVSNGVSSCAGGSAASAVASSRDRRDRDDGNSDDGISKGGLKEGKVTTFPMSRVGAVTADGHISELLPGSVYLPTDEARGGGVAEGVVSSRGKDKKGGMLKPLPPLAPLAAPVSAAVSPSQDLSR